MGATGPPGEEGGAGNKTLEFPIINFLSCSKLHNTRFKMVTVQKFLIITVEFISQLRKRTRDKKN